VQVRWLGQSALVVAVLRGFDGVRWQAEVADGCVAGFGGAASWLDCTWK
jgi:hypothetical protein